MQALATIGIYLVPFLLIGIAARRWMRRHDVGREDLRAEGAPDRRRSRFLLGVWRDDERE